MPIRKAQFEAGLTDEMIGWMKLIHRFLADHRKQAYAERELAEEARSKPEGDVVIVFRAGSDQNIEAKKRVDEPRTRPDTKANAPLHTGPVAKDEMPVFRAALQRLVQLQAVDAKPIAGAHYYIYKQELPDLK